MKFLIPVFLATPLFAQATAHAQTSASPSISLVAKPMEIGTNPPKSAFIGYQKFTDKEKLADWREANIRVEMLDGHMGHVRGAPKPKPMVLPIKEEKK